MKIKISKAATGTDVYTKIDTRTVRGDGCWGWNGAHDSRGYAIVMVPRLGEKHKCSRVHRLVLERTIGRSLLPGEVARHKCDRPGCVNPDHLIHGSYADNSRDMVQRGRGIFPNLRGTDHGSTKLTESQVREIFAASGALCKIAARFGVSDVHVSRIKIGKSWAHLGLHKTASAISRTDG